MCRVFPAYDTLIVTVFVVFVILNLPLTLVFTDCVMVRVQVRALLNVANFVPRMAQPPLIDHFTVAFLAGLTMEVRGTIRFFAKRFVTVVDPFEVVPVVAAATPQLMPFTRTQITLDARAPWPRTRYLVETEGHKRTVARPFAPVETVGVVEQPAFRTPCAVTSLVRSDVAETLPQSELRVAVELINPPVSMSEHTVSTVPTKPATGTLPESCTDTSSETPEPDVLIRSIACVEGSASGAGTCTVAMKGIVAVSLIEVKLWFNVWLISPSSYTIDASKTDDRIRGANDLNCTLPLLPVMYDGAAV